MIKMEGDRVKVQGQTIDLMAELAVLIESLHYDCKIPQGIMVDAFIMGMLGEGRSGIGKSMGISFDIKKALKDNDEVAQ